MLRLQLCKFSGSRINFLFQRRSGSLLYDLERRFIMHFHLSNFTRHRSPDEFQLGYLVDTFRALLGVEPHISRQCMDLQSRFPVSMHRAHISGCCFLEFRPYAIQLDLILS